MVQTCCPVCPDGVLEEFFSVDTVPVYCNVLWPTREEALAAPTGEIRLGMCDRCGLVHNMCFDPSLVEYTGDYENSLHFSPRFSRYAEELAETLFTNHKLAGRAVLEIGCGKGEFLALLCRGGRAHGLGFDSSYAGESDLELPDTVQIVRKPFTSVPSSDPLSLICCRQVLEHISDPEAFLAEVTDTARRTGGPSVFFEVPNGLWTLRDLGIWDIIYEHCSYFTSPSLAHLFTRARPAPRARL